MILGEPDELRYGKTVHMAESLREQARRLAEREGVAYICNPQPFTVTSKLPDDESIVVETWRMNDDIRRALRMMKYVTTGKIRDIRV